jgi:hypothetical protein
MKLEGYRIGGVGGGGCAGADEGGNCYYRNRKSHGINPLLNSKISQVTA